MHWERATFITCNMYIIQKPRLLADISNPGLQPISILYFKKYKLWLSNKCKKRYGCNEHERLSILTLM
jgi:hypothetical protein